MKTTALGLLICAILSFVLCAIVMRRMDFPKYKTELSCLRGQAEACKGEKDCCALWDGNQCRKGKIVGSECQSKGSILPALFAILGVSLLIASIVSFILAAL
jgi:hypothetical protein